MIGAIIPGILSTDSDYAAALGEDPAGGIKLFPRNVRQGIAAPYAVWMIVSQSEDQNKDARGFVTFMVQVTQHAKTYQEAEELNNKCVAALNRFRGVVAGITVNSIRVVSGGDGFVEATELQAVFSEFSIKIDP
jgi:hypothetical protein